MDTIAVMLIVVIKFIAVMIQLVLIGSIATYWLGADPYNPIVRMLRQVSEPLCRPIKRFTDRLPGPIDWAPLVLILIVITLQTGLVHFLSKFVR